MTFNTNETENKERNRARKLPNSVKFILLGEFFERFSFFGIRSMLTIFINFELGYTENSSTEIFHTFMLLCYLSPLLGAILSDSYIGNFWTIVSLSVVYILGEVILIISTLPTFDSNKLVASLLSLLFIAVGTGGIKPSYSSFGGDQFILPRQKLELEKYFVYFCLAINLASFLSYFITPIFRTEVHCFGEDKCYPLAFGIPTLSLVISLAVVIAGKKTYRLRKAQSNLVRVFKCFFYAAFKKMRSKEKKNHWLDHSVDKYGNQLVDDVKILVHVSFIFVFFPVYWSLLEQQTSRWTLQASKMNGRVGSYVFKPDQIQFINAFLTLSLLPLFDKVVYPLLEKASILRHPLHRMIVGGLLLSLSFFRSAVLEKSIEEATTRNVEVYEGNFIFINAMECQLEVIFPLQKTPHHISPPYQTSVVSFNDYKWAEMRLSVEIMCLPGVNKRPSVSLVNYVTVKAQKGATTSIIVSPGKSGDFRIMAHGPEPILNVKGGSSRLRFKFTYHNTSEDLIIVLESLNREVMKIFPLNFEEKSSGLFSGSSHEFELQIKTFKVFLSTSSGKILLKELEIDSSGVYEVYVIELVNSWWVKHFVVATQSSVHMIWLLPQYLLISIGEVMFSVNGMTFAFSQVNPTSEQSSSA